MSSTDIGECVTVAKNDAADESDLAKKSCNLVHHVDTSKKNPTATKSNDPFNLTAGGAENSDNLGGNQPKSNKRKRLNRGNTTSNQKTKMRAPQQQAVAKKLTQKSFNMHVKSCQKAIKAELENIHNNKNQLAHRKQQYAPKNTKQNFSKMIGIGSRATQFALRSKFFLPAKRPRKEVIIPPTKFLLGGNISDPLNLNGLQNESQNATPVPTPQQSPITTPPKVEVIIPPNIYDPLHLLDPVDSVEYEKQLVSPMKRKTKAKHRHRKKKPKRKSTNDSISDTSASEQAGTSAVNVPTCTISRTSSCEPTTADDANAINDSSKDVLVGETGTENRDTLTVQTEVKTSASEVNDTTKEESHDPKKETVSDQQPVATAFPFARNTEKEKSRDLKLDLSDFGGSDQHSISSAGGRKRRISEGPNKNNKFRRLDSLDKIVSPVVPQPGAWKRPPRTIVTGSRKGSRLRSTSFSESEIISPTEETKPFDGDSVRCDTPEVESLKPIPEDEEGQTSKMKPPSGQPAQKQPQATEKMPKFRADGERYQYGNFDRYSGYRNINEAMDVRVEVFHRNAHLFRNKDILDIGCNAGHITITVAKDLAPKSIVGLDIDKNLITRARRNLSMYVRIPNDKIRNSEEHKKDKNKSETDAGANASTSEKVDAEAGASTAADSQTVSRPDTEKPKSHGELNNSKQSNKNLNKKRKNHAGGKPERNRAEFFPISFPLTYGGIKDVSMLCKKESSSPLQLLADDRKFPKNVFFKTTNYVLKDESLINSETQQYDVILCLSVTKWIHLNSGDTGLKLAFKRMFNQLRPGGKLILEAQNWASYKKKKNLTETIYNNYRNIEFFPNKFHEYLLGSEVGFSHSYCLGAPRHMNKGFCRPIQLYAKGDYTPNHIRWSDNYHPQTPYEAYRGTYAGMTRPPYHFWGPLDTPRGNSGSYSCRQTPAHTGLSTSQYYNPLESDSYLPSYDNEVRNRHYVFASPLYQTVWSPPASLRNTSNKTPVFGSIREVDVDECVSRHVYPPNDFVASPRAGGGGSAFNSVREPDNDEGSQQAQSSRLHVYASCDDVSSSLPENSSSPKVDNSSSPNPTRNSNGMEQSNDDDTANFPSGNEDNE